MAITTPIEYDDATSEVRAIYDDIMETRSSDAVTVYWKTIAHHPPTLRRTWENFKETMAPGGMDALTKEMIYIAVSVSTNCDYCIDAHVRAARAMGMSEEALGELMAVVALTNGANRLGIGYGVPRDHEGAGAQ
jgi:AhpD family alkylhydroperoxidase